LAAALEICRKHQAGKIIIAAPVAGHDFVPELDQADELLFLQRPEIFRAVAQVYEHFPQLSDEEVVHYLTQAEHEHPH
jgi:putative phosphoribosyl transferase